MARQRLTRVPRAQKRKWVWARDGSNLTILANGVSFRDGLVTFQNAYDADPIGCTVSAVHLDLRVSFNAVTTPTNLVTVAMRTFTQSTLTNLTAANGPASDSHADWFVYQPMLFHNPGDMTEQLTLHLQSQRKLEELGESVLVAVQNVSGDTANISYALSIGLKLP